MQVMEQIGRYKILKTLGSGAMGTVYQGFDESIQRSVAIKVLHEKLLSGEQGVEIEQRFKQEAQAAARCVHPNIVTIFEYGEFDGGAPYIAMEYIRGVELKRYLSGHQGDLSIGRSVEIITEVLQALGYAHRHGVVHRDIKPSNIIIMPDNQVKVMDFGVARLDTSDLTLMGYMVGTPSYMSPEGLRGAQVDPRSDLYTVGIVLLELLTRQKIKVGDDVNARVKELLWSTLPAHPIRDALIDLIQKVLSLDAAARFQSADDFLDALDAAMSMGREEVADEHSEFAGTIVIQKAVDQKTSGSREDDQSYNRSRSSRSRSKAKGTYTQTSQSSLRTSMSALMLSNQVLRDIEASLAGYVGPMARVLVRRELKTSLSLPVFITQLAEHISDSTERKKFLDQLHSSGVHTALESEVSRAMASVDGNAQSSQKGATSYRFSDKEIDAFTKRLAKYIGPLAGRLVKSFAKNSRSPEHLQKRLAEKISNEQARQEFLAKA